MSSLAHMPRLDGLRAVAVGGVLLSHFWPSPFGQLSPGSIGVRIFFVLSGYLITRILLNERGPILKIASRFYWRRFLRLAPALYVAIAVVAALGIAHMRTDWWVHALYLTNFQIAINGVWGDAGHFWSLSVEEQFYILWFFVVIAARNQIGPVAVVSLIAAPLFRYTMLSSDYPMASLLLPGSVDFLMAGALIAYAEFNSSHLRLRAAIASMPVLITAVCVLLFSSFMWRYREFPRPIIEPLATIIMSASLILAISMTIERKTLRWLEWPPLVHIGKISYGIYVYHVFVPMIVVMVFPTFYESIDGFSGAGFLKLLILSALAILAAQISWVFAEKPLRAFRDIPMAYSKAQHSRIQSG